RNVDVQQPVGFGTQSTTARLVARKVRTIDDKDVETFLGHSRRGGRSPRSRAHDERVEYLGHADGGVVSPAPPDPPSPDPGLRGRSVRWNDWRPASSAEASSRRVSSRMRRLSFKTAFARSCIWLNWRSISRRPRVWVYHSAAEAPTTTPKMKLRMFLPHV